MLSSGLTNTLANCPSLKHLYIKECTSLNALSSSHLARLYSLHVYNCSAIEKVEIGDAFQPLLK